MNIDHITQLIQQEELRQQNTISLIASENYCSRKIMDANGSRLTNKYVEGYASNRYYNGCELIDEIELIAIESASRVFGAKFANVQPHSGSQANFAIFSAFLKPGDRILSMSLKHGGHLTHGFQYSITGKLYQIEHYFTDHKGFLDMDSVGQIAREFKPKLIIAGSSSYSRILDWKRFREIADEVGAYLLSDIAHYSGLIVGGVYPSPVEFSDFVTSTTHKILRGPRGGLILWNNPDYTRKINSSVFPGIQGGSMPHTVAGKAICFVEAMSEDYKEYTQNVVANARRMARILMERGWAIVTSGTDCHMFTLELNDLTGKEAAIRLEKNGLIVNKQLLPHDTRSAELASGVRIGTGAITTRGMLPETAEEIAILVDMSLRGDLVLSRVEELARSYPIP